MDISDTMTWKKQFGILPLKLNPVHDEARYLMLNGGYNDFCFQAFQESDLELDKIAWSSNVKNYITIVHDNLTIRNWYDNRTETFKKERISSNFEQFYNYLYSRSFKSESDVVPFIIDTFNQLRNLTKEKFEPLQALNMLFTLLISIEENYTSIDKIKWGVKDVELPHNFDYFVERIREGVKTAKPDLDIILRHSAGRLFQEANRNVITFFPERDLFGGISSKIITQSIAYTSLHYTPGYVSRTIVENCLSSINLSTLPKIVILDPCCGSSEFLIEILKQLKNLSYDGEIIIRGFDNSKNAIETSTFLLQYENRTQWNNSLKIELKIVEDSLYENWGSNDILLMNPPFTSFELIKDKEIKDSIKSILGSSIKRGKPNQASAFFFKAIDSLSNTGVLGTVLPSSIFTLDIYENLRNQISDRIHIKTIGKLGNFVFEDALADVSILVGSKINTPNLTKVVWTKNEKGITQLALRELRKLQSNNELSISNDAYSIYSSDHFPILENSWRITSINENKFISELRLYETAQRLVRLQEIFSVFQGALLGVKNIFNLDSQEYFDLPEKEKKYFRPLINNSVIKNGLIKPKEFIWYPYNKDGLMIRIEEELNEISFARKKLFPNKAKLEQRSENREEWWVLTRPRNWQYTSTKRLYSGRFGNSNSFGYDKSGNGVIIEGNAFFPKKNMDEDGLLFYLTVFTSEYFDHLLSIFSKQLAGGKWYDLGKNYIKNIPIPDLESSKVKDPDAYHKIVEIGKELSHGNHFAKKLAKNELRKFYPEIRYD